MIFEDEMIRRLEGMPSVKASYIVSFNYGYVDVKEGEKMEDLLSKIEELENRIDDLECEISDVKDRLEDLE